MNANQKCTWARRWEVEESGVWICHVERCVLDGDEMKGNKRKVRDGLGEGKSEVAGYIVMSL